MHKHARITKFSMALAMFALMAVATAGVMISTGTNGNTPTAEATGEAAPVLTIDNLPVPDGECASGMRYVVNLETYWDGNNDSAEDRRRVEVVGPDWPTTINVQNVDAGGVYHIAVIARCRAVDGGVIEARDTENFNYNDDGYRNDAYYATGSYPKGGFMVAGGDENEVVVDWIPSVHCDEGYRISLRSPKQEFDYTYVDLDSTEVSNYSDGFVAKTIANADPQYTIARVWCLYHDNGSDDEQDYRKAVMSHSIITY